MPDLTLSNQLRQMTRDYRFVQATEGMSPARVYRLEGSAQTLYLKISNHLFHGTTYDVEREKDIMLWLRGKLPVPEVLHFEQHEGSNFLLMSQVHGLAGAADYEQHRDPERMIRFYSDGIQTLQSVDPSDCPFDNRIEHRLAELDSLLSRNLAAADPAHWEEDTPFQEPQELYTFLKDHRPTEDLVFSHGDFCDSNFFVHDGKISAFIDLGRSGKADRWYDIAFCVRSIRNDLGNRPEHLNLFFDLLGVQPDWEKIRYYILLDELF